jgi:hypothetical protein
MLKSMKSVLAVAVVVFVPAGILAFSQLSSAKIHKGGFYHDGRVLSLSHVVDHYDRFLKLRLTPAQKTDLIEYLKSI